MKKHNGIHSTEITLSNTTTTLNKHMQKGNFIPTYMVPKILKLKVQFLSNEEGTYMRKQQLAYTFLPYNVDMCLELTMVTLGHDL